MSQHKPFPTHNQNVHNVHNVLLTPNQVPKQDATVQVDMAQEDETWSLDGVIQKEMELLVLKKLK